MLQSGNVGIGTTSPSRSLSVNSGALNIAASFESTDSGAYISFLDDSSLNDASVRVGATGNDYQLFTNGQERLRVLSTGQTGINSTAPSSNADLTLGNGELCMAETTTPGADANFGKIYCKSDNKLYFQDGAGTEHEIAFV